MGQSRPLFVYSHYFLVTISIQIEKKHRWCAWDYNPGRRMVGADKTTNYAGHAQYIFLTMLLFIPNMNFS